MDEGRQAIYVYISQKKRNRKRNRYWKINFSYIIGKVGIFNQKFKNINSYANSSFRVE